MNFRTIVDLNNAIIKNLLNIKKLDIDLVVGIPKSGMIPATIVATHLDLPFTDVYGYVSGKYYKRSGKQTVISDIPNVKKNVLLVDDSINSGKAMIRTLNIIPNNTDNIIKFAVFGSPKTKSNIIDFVCEYVELPRMFQWNIWKHDNLSMCATDMDGVLCRNPTKKEIKNNFNNFLINADVLYNMSKPIKYIITARKEKNRELTEAWLKHHQITYSRLIMKPDDHRHGNEANAEFKISVINKNSDIKLFIESDDIQAKIISKNVSIPVWCTDSQRIYNNETS